MATNYALKVMNLGRMLHGGDLMKSIVFSSLWLVNTADASDDPDFAALANVVPDARRRAVTPKELSELLRMPYETIRRQVLELERDGLCKRVGRTGYIIPETVNAGPKMIAGSAQIHQDTLMFVEELQAAWGHGPQPATTTDKT